MNQILQVPINNRYKIFFKIELYISLIILFILSLYFLFLNFKGKNETSFNRSLTQHYSIAKLYSSIDFEYDEKDINNPYIIGLLEIPSLELELPVISEINDDLLKLSVCRFFGPKHISTRKYLYRWTQL